MICAGFEPATASCQCVTPSMQSATLQTKTVERGTNGSWAVVRGPPQDEGGGRLIKGNKNRGVGGGESAARLQAPHWSVRKRKAEGQTQSKASVLSAPLYCALNCSFLPFGAKGEKNIPLQIKGGSNIYSAS